MTKARLPLTEQEALRETAALLGWERVAAIAGRRERTVRRWSEPDLPARLPFAAALALDLACLEAGAAIAPFRHCYLIGFELARARVEACLADPASCAAKAAKEAGEALCAQVNALGPHANISHRRDAERETLEAIHAFGRTLPHFQRAELG